MCKKQFSVLGLASMLCLSVFGQNTATLQKWSFKFGSHTDAVAQDILVDTAKQWENSGYGFDFATADSFKMMRQSMVANSSVYFSVALPPGDYLVSAELGSEDTASANTIKAESKRVMIASLKLEKGTFRTAEFVVHLQNKRIDSTHEVLLKPRDRDALNWDSKLTFEFSKGTAIKALHISNVKSTPILFLAGDSTVADQDLSPWASWGQFITQYFDHSMAVANYAASGASLASFKGRKRWLKILNLIKEGDYVLIEFGHNDQKRKGEGIGPWKSYTDLLKFYVKSAREKGGIPILVTPVERRNFDDDGMLIPTHGDYPAAVRAVARSLSVPLIDLTKITATLYNSWGKEDSKNAFVHYPENSFVGQGKALEDNTHFNDFGANEIALCVVDQMKHLGIGLENFLIPTQAYNPEHPNSFKDWTLPMSPRFEAVKPDGN